MIVTWGIYMNTCLLHGSPVPSQLDHRRQLSCTRLILVYISNCWKFQKKGPCGMGSSMMQWHFLVSSEEAMGGPSHMVPVWRGPRSDHWDCGGCGKVHAETWHFSPEKKEITGRESNLRAVFPCITHKEQLFSEGHNTCCLQSSMCIWVTVTAH
jgi:hypothetical protein